MKIIYIILSLLTCLLKTKIISLSIILKSNIIHLKKVLIFPNHFKN